ncbi:putative Selenide, water dikinase [Megalodesulfovibrio gigas DSM 1382 = ATCC 19364]|uniref:Putative Selenide, water dikinase n=1 Tax=Megalodesulfovibrio gigas (strain ATCC 19364 / DSM 1382 / NCIMB 9332 / VKM B-1759) TaxID=1121448 RepID=T2GE10_MEGG1|nr:putative Selenide, water dikinase [Megalodesulfovibrio gigas DSM 1382 = ATCC 19364]
MVLAGLHVPADPRVLAGTAGNEDAVVLTFPPGKALVQTVDFFTPIVDDPWRFGQIAAANALSDVYAMGGEPWSAMNIVCFPAKEMDLAVLQAMLQGGLEKVLEAGAVLAGGHSVEDREIKFGLAVSGVVEPGRIARNAGLKPGDVLVLTKPLGTGVLATAVKADWEDKDRLEDLLYRWAGRLNAAGGEVIRALGLAAATDVTGFGLGGHLLEMARASGVSITLSLQDIPFIEEAVELAGMGLLPEGSHANRRFCASAVAVAAGLDPVRSDLVFDAQTSGGLVLGVPGPLVKQAVRMLEDRGELAAIIGEAGDVSPSGDGPLLRLV